MREMKESGIAWIGAMPRAWKMNTIAQIFLQVKCKNTGLQEKNLLSLSYGKVKRKSIDTVEGLLPESFDGYNIIEKDDIVLRLTDLQNDHTSLRVGLAEERGIITSAYLTIRNRSNFCPKYLYYYLHPFDIAKGFYGMGAGVRQGLNWDGVKWLKILAPSVPEQERIAAFLDAQCAGIDAVLEKTRASIEEYKKLKQAVITQAVTKGVRGDRPMKDSGIEWIGDIPAEWDVLNLVAHTSMLTPMRDRPENLDGPIPWVRIEDFEGKYIESSKAGLGVSMKTVKEMNLKVYPVGTILCTSSCIMGKCAIVSRELVSNQRFIGIIPDRTTDKTYLYYLMTSNAERMNFLSTGALQANLSRSAFEHLKVQFPPYSEQQEIAAYLDDKCEKIDELILKKQQYLTEIENYKKSLIYEYVTGKKEGV